MTSTDVYKGIVKNMCEFATSKYDMKCSGIYESADKEKKYKKVGLNFHVKGPIPKEKGRAMMLDILDEFLELINTTRDFEPYMTKHPFDPENVSISFFVSDQSGRRVYYPEILIFSTSFGKLEYSTKVPEQEFGYHTKEFESIAEARAKINNNTKV